MLHNLTSQLMVFLSKIGDSPDEVNTLVHILRANRFKDKSYLNTPIFHPPNLMGTPLMIACMRSNLEAARYLIEYGADVNVKDFNESTVLIQVLRVPQILSEGDGERRKSIVKLLIDNGADVNTNDHRYFALAVAARGSTKIDSEIVEMLITAKADVNSRSIGGRTPLMMSGSAETTRLLLDNGALVDIQDDCGQTALMYHLDKLEIMKELIQAGSNIYHRDYNGSSVLEHCDSSNCIPETLHLVKLYLESIYLFFKNTSPGLIDKTIKNYLRDPLMNQEIFPVNNLHLLAIKWLNEFVSKKTRENLGEEFYSDFYFMAYFGSLDFQEKILSDVILRLDENDVEIDGETLRGKRVRAKSRTELENILEFLSQISEKQNLAKQFFQQTETLYKLLFDVDI